MSHKNIDSILKDRVGGPMNMITAPGTPSTSGIPVVGEEVGVKTLFEENLQVEITAVSNGGNTCQGEATTDAHEGDIGDMKLIIEFGEHVEFSCSKIIGIDRA